MHRPLRSAAVALAAAAALAACSAPAPAPDREPAPGKTTAAPVAALEAWVGSAEQPEADVIALGWAGGADLDGSSLPAGAYSLSVGDHSGVNDVHLYGPGVDRSTEAAWTGRTTWDVELGPGTYAYWSDADPVGLRGSFVVR